MLVGDANKGKTSLLQNLTKKRGKMIHHTARDIVPLSTVGVDLGEFTFSPPQSNKPPITFMTWDFGGQVSSLLDNNVINQVLIHFIIFLQECT